MLEAILIWFVMTNQAGFIEPQRVEMTAAVCGLPGAVVGVQINRLENPSVVSWPDPMVVDQHCQADISARVKDLVPGEYHIATTELTKLVAIGTGQPYIGIDPHTTVHWLKSTAPAPVGRPTNVKIPGVK